MNANSDKDYIDAKVDGIRAVLDERTEAIRESMREMRVAVEAKIVSTVESAVSQLVKWMVGTFIATIAIFITVMTFVLNNAVPKTPAPAATVPAVIIQVTPQGVSVLPVAPAVPPKP
ncbi:hypothetical protein [Duganella sp. LjRoot269]|jgi:hypothetical protein|uniref:hypothetical protein n=1 Tax=Duganella sp. LjRoot269 TaxID=3342305 RepID=UPI003ECE2D11